MKFYSPHSLIKALLIFFITTTLWAQKPVLLGDFATGNKGSNPEFLTVCGQDLYFTADDGIHGRELWKANGPNAQPILLKDLCEGVCASSPKNLCAVNSTLFFTAYESDKGTELWKTDGTEKGTVRVKDINSGRSNFSPRYLCALNGILYFTADDGKNGAELWRSDGSEQGTYMVKDIDAGAAGAHPQLLTSAGDLLLFKASIKGGAESVWQSDGTASGTVKIADGVQIKNLKYLANKKMVIWLDQKAVVTKNPMGAKLELKAYDGPKKQVNVLQSVDVTEGVFGLSLEVVNGDWLCFGLKHTLWKTDGTAAATQVIKSLPGVSRISQFQVVNQHLIFNAEYLPSGKSGAEIAKEETFISDLSSEGTFRLLNRSIRYVLFHQNRYVLSTGRDFHTCLIQANKPVINPLSNQGIEQLSDFFVYKAEVLFKAYDAHKGNEIGSINAACTQVQWFADINQRGNNFDAFDLKPYGNLLMFMRVADNQSVQLWKSNGSKEGTQLITQLYASSDEVDFGAYTECNGLFYFICKNDRLKKIDLWCSNGSKESTKNCTQF